MIVLGRYNAALNRQGLAISIWLFELKCRIYCRMVWLIMNPTLRVTVIVSQCHERSDLTMGIKGTVA
jgi:hypothetical protein